MKSGDAGIFPVYYSLKLVIKLLSVDGENYKMSIYGQNMSVVYTTFL